MKKSIHLICLLLAVTTTPVVAHDSTPTSATASGASLAAVSVAPASALIISAYAGGVLIVESVRFVGEVVEVVFKGALNASRAVVTVSAAAAAATSITAGQSVRVVTEGSGYLLVAGGKVLCYVPAETSPGLLRSTRSQ